MDKIKSKLNECYRCQWEVREGSQIVSSLITTKEEADEIAKKLEGFNPGVVKSRNANGYRISFEVDEIKTLMKMDEVKRNKL